MFEQHEMEVPERDVLQPEAASPGLGEGRLDQEQVRQEHRQGRDEHGIAEHRPAPPSQQDGPPLAALAGQRHEALAPRHQALDQDQQDGDPEQRHGIGRCHLDPHRIAEELEELRRHDVEARRDGDHGRRAEQRDRLEKADDQPTQDRRKRERQGDPPHGAPWPRSQDVGCILHLRRHQLERRRGEDEDVGERVERDDDGEAGEAVDVERPRLGAGHHREEAVEPAGIGTGQQDPRHGAGVGRRDEGRQHHHTGEAAARHVGTRHRPGERHREDAGQQCRRAAELQRIHQRIDVARSTISGGVVGEGELAGLFGREAGDHQVDERAHHQEQQDRDDRDPDQPRRIEEEGAPRRVRCREGWRRDGHDGSAGPPGPHHAHEPDARRTRLRINLPNSRTCRATARSPRGCPCRSRPRSAGWS